MIRKKHPVLGAKVVESTRTSDGQLFEDHALALAHQRKLNMLAHLGKVDFTAIGLVQYVRDDRSSPCVYLDCMAEFLAYNRVTLLKLLEGTPNEALL